MANGFIIDKGDVSEVEIGGKLSNDGYSKYMQQEKMYSIDNGVTWKSYEPKQYRIGKLVEVLSSDCGYVPTTDTYTVITYSTGIERTVRFPSGEMDGTYTNGNVNISAVTVGLEVTSIGDAAFANCSVVEVTLPANINYIGDNAFENCKGLNSISFNGTKEKFSHIEIGVDAFKGVVSLIGCDCIHCTDGDYPIEITS